MKSAGLIKAIEDTGQLDNTLVFLSTVTTEPAPKAVGTACSTNTPTSTAFRNRSPTCSSIMDQWGGPETYPHMAAGWAVAFDSPLSWTKQVASDFGGTSNGMVVHWPKGIKAKERISHAIQPRDRCRADHPGSRRPAGAQGGQRHAADTDGGREHGLHLRQCQGQRPPHHPILRDVRKPGDLPRRLVCPHHPPGSVGEQACAVR